MTKLYKVRMLFETVVTQPNVDLAVHGLLDDMKIGEYNLDQVAFIAVEHKEDLPHGWCDAIPWGEKEDRTCVELLNAPSEVTDVG